MNISYPHIFAVHDIKAGFSRVGFGGSVVKLVRLAQNKLVFAFPEWISEQSDWVKVDITITAFGLECTRAIEVPDWQVIWLCWLHVDSFGFAAKTFSSSIDPNIHRLYAFTLI